jgi:hypothetical protein
MASNLVEFFGYDPLDRSPEAASARREGFCPWVGSQCVKQFRDGTISGACTLKPVNSGPVIICPIRLYEGGLRVLLDVAKSAFGQGVRLIRGEDVRHVSQDGLNVAVFGKGWGKELRLPTRGGQGGYFVDWILARIGEDGTLAEFVAVEVQSIDTTGNYREEVDAYRRGEDFRGASTAGLNWENVSKRILPQIIYKGHVLRREPLCGKGMFFICPAPVYDRILRRLGGELDAYHLHPGSLVKGGAKLALPHF